MGAWCSREGWGAGSHAAYLPPYSTYLGSLGRYYRVRCDCSDEALEGTRLGAVAPAGIWDTTSSTSRAGGKVQSTSQRRPLVLAEIGLGRIPTCASNRICPARPGASFPCSLISSKCWTPRPGLLGPGQDLPRSHPLQTTGPIILWALLTLDLMGPRPGLPLPRPLPICCPRRRPTDHVTPYPKPYLTINPCPGALEPWGVLGLLLATGPATLLRFPSRLRRGG